MKCHYEVLGVPINADSDVIKKAYRRKALQFHPDKNIENAEEATEKFRLVQAAYDVLSDPHEKAWYDKHRSDILHKSQFKAFQDGSFDILEYFTPSVYKGFGNDSKGFYAIYRELFNKISMEDNRFCMDDSDDVIMPEFGDAESNYDEVVNEFYGRWQAYRTRISFAWTDKYDLHDAPDRRVARLIGKENKKEREKEKRKRNEIVRDLVSFVRKRDPRVRAHREELERRVESQTKKAAAKRLEMLRARGKEAAMYEERNKGSHEEHLEQVMQLESLLKDEFGFSSEEEESCSWEEGSGREEEQGEEEQSEEEQSEEEDLYCVACNKQFKTPMALSNHQKSKKHRDKLSKLRADMSRDTMEEQFKAQSTMEDDDDTPTKQKLTKKQKKKRRQNAKLFNDSDDDVILNDDVITNDDVTPNDDVITNHNVITKDDGIINDDVITDNDVIPNDDVITDNDVITNNDISTKNTMTKDDDIINNDVTIPSEQVLNDKTPPSGRTDDMRGKRTKSKKKQIKSKSSPQTTETNCCTSCDMEFATRNKLFQHLKSSGHSVAVPGGRKKRK